MMRRSAIRNVCSLALGFALVALMARATVAQWSAAANLPSNVTRAVGVFFPGNGKFYAMGGRTSDAAGSDLTHPLEYNPTANTWTTKVGATYPDNQVNNMACGVLTFSATPLIVCVGGSAAGQVTATARVFTYDPVSNTLVLLALDNWPGNVAGTILPGGFAVVNNKLYILGGFNINVASTNQIWEFDPSLGVGSRWTQRVNTPVGIMYAPTTAINGIIYVGGASDFAGGLVVDTVNSFSYNPTTNTTGVIAAIPRATGETRAINFGGRMWVLGGGRVAPNPSNEVDVYNPGTNSWATGLPFTTARRNFAADSDGTRVWLAGGYDATGVTIASTERFTPPTASSSTISGVITSADGSALAGVTIHLSGTQTRLTITDSSGNYRLDDVETGGFYTLTPSRANFVFTPVDRSFTQLGNHTDAAFTGSFTGDSANPDDTTEYFVRQHYLDFLGREPDQGGFEYWSGQINLCNGDADCIRSWRIAVSAAFFASPEFQQTGSYVYSLYAGALGRTPGYEEFMPDRLKVVGGSDLDASKAKFTDAFVQRSEFTAKYPQGLTSDQFVDALLQTMSARSGADLSSLRNTMLSDYDKGGRSLVVSDAVQATEFAQAEYNKAFVLMEYFGYLRRNPDTGGYDFWLNLLNGREAGNYRGMVCAFITSTEYQRRFSTLITHSNSECGH